MGRIRKFVDFDWAGADASVQRAMALEPGNPEYLDQAAYSAAMFSRSDEALALARRAVELDPLNPDCWSALGEIKYFESQFAGAEADVKKSLELSPDVFPGPNLLSKIYVMEGRLQDALAEIERVRTDLTRAWLYAVTYAAQGREKESDAALKELIAKYSTRAAYSVVPVARPGLRSTRRQLSLHEFGPDAKELAERPALFRILEEAQPAELKCVGVLKSNLWEKVSTTG
jgi:tetratricopeptide (TPR) repeat protein